MRKIVAMIPARYASSRFPGKPLAMICGKPMIQHVYENISSCKEISSVYVATDDDRIFDAVQSFGGIAFMTSPNHDCGTDRLAECAQKIPLKDEDVVLNIQGDEPLVGPGMVSDLIRVFEDSSVKMGTLKKELIETKEVEDPNIVKVVTDRAGDALYFSRYPVPFCRNSGFVKLYKHIGVYGYTKQFLLQFSLMPKSPLERTESLEQLRVIENGYKIRVKETNWQTVGVDTPEQLCLVERYIKEKGLV